MRHALILAVWVLFAVCFVVGIVLRRRFTQRLMENHSVAYAELGGPPPQLLPYNSHDNLAALQAQGRFVREKKYRALGDRELERLGEALLRVQTAQVILGLCFGGLVALEIAST